MTLCYCSFDVCNLHAKEDCKQLCCECSKMGCSRAFNGLLIGGGDSFILYGFGENRWRGGHREVRVWKGV